MLPSDEPQVIAADQSKEPPGKVEMPAVPQQFLTVSWTAPGDQDKKPAPGDNKQGKPVSIEFSTGILDFSTNIFATTTPRHIRAVLNDLESTDGKTRQDALEELKSRGTKSIPAIQEFMSKTTSLEAYSKARSAVDSIRQANPTDPAANPFPLKYDKKLATELIDQLGDRNPLDRTRAMDQLIAMGPAVRKDLVKTVDKHPDVGAKKHAADALDELDQLERAQDMRVGHKMITLYNDFGIKTEATDRGYRFLHPLTKEFMGPMPPAPDLAMAALAAAAKYPQVSIKYDTPTRTALTKADHEAFQAAIALGDKLGADPEKSKVLADLLNMEWNSIQQKQQSGKAPSKGEQEQLNARQLNSLATSARIAYAHALSHSPNADDRLKAVEMLTKGLTMSMDKGSAKHAPTHTVTAIASRIDPIDVRKESFTQFMRTFTKAGGDPQILIDRLQIPPDLLDQGLRR